MTAAFLCIALLLSSSACSGKAWKRDKKTGKYSYPVTQESKEWLSLTHSEKIAACTIPDEVLADVTDMELVELVLSYPLLNEIWYYRDVETGICAVSTFFPPLRTVIEEGLLEAYAEAFPGEEGKPQFPENSTNEETYMWSLFIECVESLGGGHWMEFPIKFREEEGITALLDRKWERDADTGKYEYPLNPYCKDDDYEADYEVWITLLTAGMEALCEVPEYVIEDVTDEELVELFLKYPQLGYSSFFGDNVKKRMDYLVTHFRVAQLVQERGLLDDYLREHMTESGEVTLPEGKNVYYLGMKLFVEEYIEYYKIEK